MFSVELQGNKQLLPIYIHVSKSLYIPKNYMHLCVCVWVRARACMFVCTDKKQEWQGHISLLTDVFADKNLLCVFHNCLNMYVCLLCGLEQFPFYLV